MTPRLVTPILFLAAVMLWSSPAMAEPAATAVAPPVDSVRLIGKTYCFPWAAPDAACDVRMSPTVRGAGAGDEGLVLAMAGFRMCIGPVPPEQGCDLRVTPDGSPSRKSTGHAGL